MNIDLKKHAEKIYDWAITHGPGILLGIGVLIIGLWLINILSKVIRRTMAKKDFDPTVESFMISLIISALRVMLILGVMQIVGIQMTIFAAVIGAFGVAVGLALSGTLQNFASGVLILLLKPFRVGDNLITQGQEGTVSTIQIFYTIITTFDNKTVIVPNSKLSNEVIINMSKEGKRRLDLEIKLNYNIDQDVAKDVINKSLESFESVLKDPKWRIGISIIALDGYSIMVNAWVKVHGFEDTRLALQDRLVKEMKNAGVKFTGMQ